MAIERLPHGRRFGLLLGSTRLASRFLDQSRECLGHCARMLAEQLPELADDAALRASVIDLGSDDGLVPNAEMLIHRKDALVGKVTISGIARNMAIAELQPDWVQASVKEGDYVVF